jgi:hypothetical protein
MQVASTKSISFPKLGWSIGAGETRDLPADRNAQERILSEHEITAVKASN